MTEINEVQVLVTGGRDFEFPDAIIRAFGRVVAAIEDCPPCEYRVVLYHGGARGADRMADDIAVAMGWETREFKADWKASPKLAGHQRNQVMLDEFKRNGGGWVFAFKTNLDPTLSRGGTEDMIRRIKKAGLTGTLIRR